MNQLGVLIEFPEEIRELYVKYDFKYFFNKITKTEEEEKIAKDEYNKTITRLNKEIKKNKAQAIFHIDGAVRKMHSGGLLPSHFELDETRELESLDYKGYGDNWAYFDLWKKYEKKKVFRRKIKASIIYWGSILGYILAVIKIIEEISH